MKRRKVEFQELHEEFNPDGWDPATEELMKKKEGFFHTWVVEEEKSPYSEQPVSVPKTKALIEKEDGTMVAVDYSNIRFLE